MPQNEQEWMDLSREFEALWNFPHSIGTWDAYRDPVSSTEW